MNRTNIIGLVIIIALLIGYSIWMTPSKQQREAARHYADSIEQARLQDSAKTVAQQKIAKLTADSLAALQGKTGTSSKTDTTKSNFTSTAGPERFYTLETDKIRLRVSSKGGRIWSAQLKEFRTFDSMPLMLFEGDSNRFAFEFNTQNLRTVNTGELNFVPTGANETVKVSGKDSVKFALRCYPSAADSGRNSFIEYVYTLRGNDYMVGYQVHFVNMKPFLAQNIRDVALNWSASLYQKEKSHKNEQNLTTIYSMDDAGEVENLKESKSEKAKLTTPIKWVSFKQQFFSTTLIANGKFSSADIETVASADPKGRLLKNMSAFFVLAYDNEKDQSYAFNWYLGPNKYKVMRAYHLNLERQIPLGWSFFLLQWINRGPVLWVFNWLESFALNYGIIILILTVLLKIVLFPIAWKTYVSSAKMRILKPEIEEINQKFPKKEDAMKKQQATMALYKKAGVNPMAGCVPMLLQFPILIAFFRFFPAAFELRQQPFLWANDLSSYDSILNLPFTIPWYGDHVSLFCLLMTISTIIYTKMNNDMMGSTQQLPGMKTMMYMMPIMFLGFFNDYSSGLSYYYLLANLFTFAQMFLIRRFVNEDKLHARIQENKAKPVKKSNFQKRLEEISRKQQAARR